EKQLGKQSEEPSKEQSEKILNLRNPEDLRIISERLQTLATHETTELLVSSSCKIKDLARLMFQLNTPGIRGESNEGYDLVRAVPCKENREVVILTIVKLLFSEIATKKFIK
ncbi:MAG: hypothetical protein ACD_19C00335G0001, partial [uncultured bacterium]